MITARKIYTSIYSIEFDRAYFSNSEIEIKMTFNNDVVLPGNQE